MGDRYAHAVHSPILGLVEGLVEARRDPGVALVDVAADRQHMHGRMDLGAHIHFALDLAEIRKQSDDVRILAEARRTARRDHRVDLAARKKLGE